jgi:Raf kinase inhibitor-like YbhB/YbcL family protein
MLKGQRIVVGSLIILAQSSFSFAGSAFEVHSNDVADKSTITNDFVFQGMGCNGGNKSPEIHWSGAPKGTKSFAVTVYDPTAPTGSGFWHWIVANVPAGTTSLQQGWKSSGEGAVEIVNDFGTTAYGGPCPPQGKKDTYVFTVHALKTEKIDFPAGVTNAVARFMIEGATIKKAQFKAFYSR